MKCRECKRYSKLIRVCKLVEKEEEFIYDKIIDHRGETIYVENKNWKLLKKELRKEMSFFDWFFPNGIIYKYFVRECTLNKNENCKFFNPIKKKKRKWYE